ncbi:oligosaccharide flippase family protein [Anaerocolumna aminovalerica]|uniref:oligosaccharide flippase family protein n=1 Tax=Anaerocolumna aminovalerica TaxID=1527 RepID=UPI001C0EC577|nr:oligosaccharide flippase family protein [Anaerocolumna aminovalerica]MBU5331138.1 oligosaccharide flippase family protein [Anaerocolumna aminovalerica]
MEISKVIKSKFFKNGIWLYILQIFNTLIPLLTLPYIIRVLGANQYGVFSKLLNIVLYAQAIVEYGFNLTGAKKVAIAENKNELSRIFSRILVSKIVLLILSLILTLLFVLMYPLTIYELVTLFILFIIVFSETIRQTWIFQGLQEMKFITIVTVISKIVSLVLIFTLVKNSGDLLIYSLLYSIAFLLVSILSSFIVRFKFDIRYEKVTFIEVRQELKEGWYLFTSSASSKIFSGIGITVLTFTSSNLQIGMYSAIQKIPYMLAIAYAPIGQIIYPFISKKYNESIKDGLAIMKKIIKYIFALVIVVLVILILLRENIINILYGKEYIYFKDLVIPLGIGFLFSVLNNLFGIQMLVASGFQKQYSIGFNISTLILIMLTISMGFLFEAFGVAYASMISEGILLIINLLFVKKLVVNN